MTSSHVWRWSSICRRAWRGAAILPTLCRHTDAVSYFRRHPKTSKGTKRATSKLVRPVGGVGAATLPTTASTATSPMTLPTSASKPCSSAAGGLTLEQAVDGYEERLWHEAVEHRQQITATQEDARTARAEAAAALQAHASAQRDLTQLQQRRAAENAAAREALDEQTRNQTNLASPRGARKQAEIQELAALEIERIYQTKIFRYSRVLRRVYRATPSSWPSQQTPLIPGQ